MGSEEPRRANQGLGREISGILRVLFGLGIAEESGRPTLGSRSFVGSSAVVLSSKSRLEDSNKTSFLDAFRPGDGRCIERSGPSAAAISSKSRPEESSFLTRSSL